LQVPALGVRAVWLHDASGKAPDILVPVAPVRPELVAGRRYTLAEFTAALKDAAAKILANDDPRKGSSDGLHPLIYLPQEEPHETRPDNSGVSCATGRPFLTTCGRGLGRFVN